MPLTVQRVSPGSLSDAHREESNRLAAAEAVRKMWARQPGLWTDDAEHARIIANRLGWIGVPEAMRAEAPALSDFARDVRQSGVRDVVLLGMGGSIQAAEVFSLNVPAASGLRFFVLDSTDPASIQEVESSIDLAHSLFIVASKSGKTLETLSQFFYFHHRLAQAGIPPDPSFVAITDRGSYLNRLADEYSFRKIFFNPADIGGRDSALTYFGLVPAALCGVDLVALLEGAIEMREACGPDAASAANPALQLASLLGAAARRGDDKLFLFSTPRLASFADWIEQSVAESTGKEERGIIPVTGSASLPSELLAGGGVTVALLLDGDDPAVVRTAVHALEQRGAPFVEIRLQAPEQFGAEFFKWETATALVAASLAVDPFDEPNVQESKDNTARILEEFESSGKMPLGTPRLAEAGIELYADGAVRGAISTLQLPVALRTFFSETRPDDYVAILAYVARNPANAAALGALRATLSQRLGLPVLLEYGPRYLHSIGQLFKGGPETGMFLIITSEKPADVPIPGGKYTFGQLQMAQALGDLQSLARIGKPALRLHLMEGVPGGFTELRRAVEQALSASRSAD